MKVCTQERKLKIWFRIAFCILFYVTNSFVIFSHLCSSTSRILQLAARRSLRSMTIRSCKLSLFLFMLIFLAVAENRFLTTCWFCYKCHTWVHFIIAALLSVGLFVILFFLFHCKERRSWRNVSQACHFGLVWLWTNSKIFNVFSYGRRLIDDKVVILVQFGS